MFSSAYITNEEYEFENDSVPLISSWVNNQIFFQS